MLLWPIFRLNYLLWSNINLFLYGVKNNYCIDFLTMFHFFNTDEINFFFLIDLSYFFLFISSSLILVNTSIHSIFFFSVYKSKFCIYVLYKTINNYYCDI